MAYACEVDARLWSLFTNRIGTPNGHYWNQWVVEKKQNGINQIYSAPLFACFARRVTRIAGHVDADSNPDPDPVIDNGYGQDLAGLYSSQRDVFNFDEIINHCDDVVGGGDGTPSASSSGLLLPPALVSDPGYGTWTGENNVNYWSCPLPRHPYGCLAEHTAGMELLLERGDLDVSTFVCVCVWQKYRDQVDDPFRCNIHCLLVNRQVI